MLVDVILYKTKLSTTDTMVFDGDTPEEVRANQLSFFNSLEKKTFSDKLSFNGRRSLRINGNYWLLNLDGYNYCSIKFENKTYYAFIDEFVYVNDNSVEIRVTTDYIQTYLTDIKFSPLFIEQRNYSLSTDVLADIPYKNTYPIGGLSNVEEVSLSIRFTGGDGKIKSLFFICVILDVSSSEYDKFKEYTLNIPLNALRKNLGKEINTNNSVCLFLFPCYADISDSNQVYATKLEYIDLVKIDDGTSNFFTGVEDFIDKYNSAILDVFIADGLTNGIDVTVDGITYTLTVNTGFSDIEYINPGEYEHYLILKSTSVVSTPTKRIIFNDYKFNLFRSPYYNIYIGRDGSTMSLLNPFELSEYSYKTSGSKIAYRDLYYAIFQEVLPTYTTKVKISKTRRKYDSIYSFDPIIDNFLFSKDKWAEYKLSHSASVGDSLATKHAYDIEIAERNYANQKNIANTNRIIGGVNTGANAISDVIGGVANINVGGISQILRGIGSAVSGGVKTGLEYEQSLENASVAYENAKTTIQQERALLEIEYNNIKNSPATINNLSSSGCYVYLFDTPIKINVLQASNIEEIIKYHKRFGFETSLQTDITTIKDTHDSNARYFDYIRALNANVISENIPKTSADIIAKIFDNGIYLWRNYEKLGEDYLSNYDGE